ncbi:MAG: cyclic nucleotide-binding domain-containing protein [Spirochaetales bacterium]|nr:MAG: cyclic nucleotide-binding domain-containing protein [Spirochaetales bacterium]
MNVESDLTDTIRSIPGFDRLDDAAAAAIASAASLSSFSEEEIAYREDDTGNDVYYLISGLMESRMRMPGRSRQLEEGFITLKSGDIFGETSFLDGGRRESSVVARERSLALRLDGTALRSVCDGLPPLAAIVYRTLGRSLAVRYRDASLELRNSWGMY